MAYILAKHGVLRLVRHTSAAWGRRGARIVSVSPGVIETPMGLAEIAAGNGTAEMIDLSALGRAGHPEEVARVIAFLCSEDSSYVTGTDILVDGGTTAALNG